MANEVGLQNLQVDWPIRHNNQTITCKLNNTSNMNAVNADYSKWKNEAAFEDYLIFVSISLGNRHPKVKPMIGPCMVNG